MPPVVKLADLTAVLDFLSEETDFWLDRQSSRVVMVDHEVMAAVEATEGDEAPVALADWQQEQVSVARGVLAGDARYLALPDKFDFHEYHHMERFIRTVDDADQADQLWRAIKGRGAFRFFRDTADRLGLSDAWYRYRDEAMDRFMLDWAEENQVEVDASPGRSGPSP